MKRRRTEFGLSAWLRLCYRTSDSEPRLRAPRRLLGLTLALAGLVTGAASAQDLGIRQYKPKSTLVVAEHPVPRAKYPVIDIHSHHGRLTPERWAEVVKEMDGQHLQVLVNLSGGTGARLEAGLKIVADSPAPDRMVFFANLDFSDLDQPGYGARAAARLEADLKAGARGLKIFKNFGIVGEARRGRSRAGGRSRVRPGVADLRATPRAGADPHGRARAVFRAGHRDQRAMARTAGPPRTPAPGRRVPRRSRR